MRTIRKLLIGRSALPGGGGCAASASPAGGVSGVAPSPSPSASSRQGRRRGPVAHRPGDDGGRLRGGIVEMGVDGGGAPLAVPEQPSHRDQPDAVHDALSKTVRPRLPFTCYLKVRRSVRSLMVAWMGMGVLPMCSLERRPFRGNRGGDSGERTRSARRVAAAARRSPIGLLQNGIPPWGKGRSASPRSSGSASPRRRAAPRPLLFRLFPALAG